MFKYGLSNNNQFRSHGSKGQQYMRQYMQCLCTDFLRRRRRCCFCCFIIVFVVAATATVSVLKNFSKMLKLLFMIISSFI
jgi:hypothetical protein